MCTHRIELAPMLTAEEVAVIDAAAVAAGRGATALPALAAALKTRAGVDLVTDPDIVAGFKADSSNLPGAAEALARPASEREVAAVARACFAAGIPLTVSAGRSNLTGSATPQGGVVMSLANLLSPAVTVDRAARLARAPVGLILETFRQQVIRDSAGKLLFPVDPTSRADATVGGAVACNASGFTPGEVGATRHWVESLEAVLPNGWGLRARRGQYVSRDGAFALVTPAGETAWPVPRYARPAIKNAGGPFSAPDGCLDLVDLFVGSEGLFGIVTGVTLRLRPAPACYLDLFFSVPGEDEAVRLREYLAATLPGGVGGLTALEYFGANCRRYMAHDGRLFHGADPVAVYIQVPLEDGQADSAAEIWLERLLASGCGVREEAVLVLDNDRDRALFFEARHSMPARAVELVQQRGTFTIMTDTVVPPDRFPAFLRFAHEAIRGAGLDYLSFGHLGDCHLHFTLLPTREQLAAGAATYDRLVAVSAELGGVYSGEHGTGKRKRADFLKCYGTAAAEDVRRCKAAVDPGFILNRGNVIA